MKKYERVLELISGNHKLILPVSDGKCTIAQVEDTFPYWIDSYFKKWKTNKPGEATPEIYPQVYRLVKNANFAKIFGSLANNINKLCLTQNNIIDFVKIHYKWLKKDGYGTFFLIKIGDKFFVVGVAISPDRKRCAALYSFKDDNEWKACHHHRIVVPQLNS